MKAAFKLVKTTSKQACKLFF